MRPARAGKAPLPLCLGAILFCSCASRPNEANILLRKENQQFQGRIDQLQREQAGLKATIQALESRATTVPVLPAQRLGRLFTVHGLKLGRGTGGADLDATRPGDEALKVQVIPLDQDGDALKAAGQFTVEAFDFADGQQPLVGRWVFTTEEATRHWFGNSLLYSYLLTCPWPSQPPRHQKLLVRVVMVDELTGRRFEAEKVVGVTPP